MKRFLVILYSVSLLFGAICINDFAHSTTIKSFLYDGTNWTILDYPGTSSTTRARDIDGNNIVGIYSTDISGHGFLYDGTNWTTLPDHPDATSWTQPFGIDGNNIVGYYYDGAYHGFLYDGTNWTTLDYNGDSNSRTRAFGIDGNNIVGVYTSTDQGFLYDGTNWTTLDYPGTSGTTIARDIDGNNIVGEYVDGDGAHGFLYDGTNWTTLDYPGASGSTDIYGIDGSNIVGQFYDYNDYAYHGFLYDGTNWTTLDYPGASDTRIYGIDGNNIVGTVYNPPETVSIDIDIIPKTCPNECPIKGGGAVEVVVHGTTDFDVNDIDIASVRLVYNDFEVPSSRSSIKDKSSPLVTPRTNCECSTDGRDGFLDLCLKFDKKAIITAIETELGGDVELDTEYHLTLTGVLIGGTLIEGEDCIVFVKKGKKH